MRRRAATILAGDVVGFSRMVAENEDETIRRLTAYQRAFESFVDRHGGRIFNTAGDSVMCEFAGPLEAMRAAIDIQEAFRSRNLAYPPQRWLQFRIGISTGEVAERNGDLLGTAVNIAARLEKLATPGGICISRNVHEAVSGQIAVPFVDLGERRVKNIPVPVHAFAIAWPGTEIHPVLPDAADPDRKRILRWAAGICGAALLLSASLASIHFLTREVGRPREGTASPAPALEASYALSLPGDPAEIFAQLSQKGGLIEDPKSAPGLYYKALLFEAKGETVGAHRAYYTLARMGLEFIDPHLRYASLVRAHEGEVIARQVYAELHEDSPTRATALVHALQFEGPERRARIRALIEEHPDFAPAHFFLAEEHKGDIHSQTPVDRQAEFAALAEFLRAEQEGRLKSFFLDQAVATGWLDKARKRHARLEFLLKSASAINP